MPAIAAAPAFYAAIAGGAATVGATALANRAQGNASKRASAIQSQSDANALAFAQAQEDRRKQEFDATAAAEERRWLAEQEQARLLFEEDQRRYAEEQAYRRPYRQASHGAMTALADLIGMKVGPYQEPQDPYAYAGPSVRMNDVARQPSESALNTTMPVSRGGTFSKMIPRFAPVDPRRKVSLKSVAGY